MSDFSDAYTPESSNMDYVDQPQQQQPQQSPTNVTMLDPEADELKNLYQNKINQMQTELNQQINGRQQEINDLSQLNLSLQSELNLIKKKEYSVDNLKQICKVNNTNKWFITIVISLFILFFMSTYSVSVVDRWLDNNGVDLFSTNDKMNELLLLIIQFLLIVIMVRIILQFV